jgi:hypothetical protein
LDIQKCIEKVRKIGLSLEMFMKESGPLIKRARLKGQIKEAEGARIFLFNYAEKKGQDLFLTSNKVRKSKFKENSNENVDGE